jgi:type IV secretion system protein TrbG
MKTFLFLALTLVTAKAGVEPPSTPDDQAQASPVWTPPFVAAPAPSTAPRFDAVAAPQPAPAPRVVQPSQPPPDISPSTTADKASLEQPAVTLAATRDASNAASQQDKVVPPPNAPLPSPTPSDLVSDLAAREDEPVRLTMDEAAGVQMTNMWRARARDYQSQSSDDGAVQFVFSKEIPSVVCAVLQVTDVALEPGEAITSISTGDNLRWSVENVVSGEAAGQQPHLVIKPFARGLTTSVVVTTTRRTYHLSLRSTDRDYMHEVSFAYPGEPPKQAAPPQKETKPPQINVAMTQEVPTPEKKPSVRAQLASELPRERASARRDPQSNGEWVQDPDSYRIEGNPRWRPTTVYNDGKKTHIVMTEEMTKTEAPALLVLRRNNYAFGYDKVLSNYRVQHKTYSVDTVFDRAILVSGRDKVTIVRVPGKVRQLKNVEPINAGTAK